MGVILRSFREGDFQTLWELDQQCFAPGMAYSRIELAAYLRRKGALTLVAESAPPSPGGKAGIRGFIIAQAGARGGHIITLDVASDHRGRGIGSQLLTAAEEQLARRACGSVFLETAVDNRVALSFYKRHGYDVRGTVPRYYANGVDALLLEKRLPAKAAEG